MADPRRVRVLGDLYHGRVPDGAVYIGRQAPGLPRSPYANPHTVGAKGCRACGGRVHTRDEAVALYAGGLTPELVERARREIGDADVACWCRVGDACHGDPLLVAMRGEAPQERPDPPQEPSEPVSGVPLPPTASQAPTDAHSAALRQRVADALKNTAVDCNGNCGRPEDECLNTVELVWTGTARQDRPDEITWVQGTTTAIADAVLDALDRPPTFDVHLTALEDISRVVGSATKLGILDTASIRGILSAALGVKRPEDPAALAKARQRITEEDLANARRLHGEDVIRAVQAEATIARVRQRAERWAALAPPDDWGDNMADTVFADAGRLILADLDRPAEQTGGGNDFQSCPPHANYQPPVESSPPDRPASTACPETTVGLLSGIHRCTRGPHADNQHKCECGLAWSPAADDPQEPPQ